MATLPNHALLVLADGTVYEGESFGAAGGAHGEVVFTTTMTGYQEVLTDPSFAGQVVVMTYPLIGNYGINVEDVESRQVQVRGFVVREACQVPSHWRSGMTVGEYLSRAGIPGIAGVDTRAITRRIRSHGVMMGLITTELGAAEAVERLRSLPDYGSTNFVPAVSTDHAFRWQEGPERPLRIVVVDFGVKYNILRILESFGCEVVVLPYSATAAEVLAERPDGVLLSPGPGDPAFLQAAVVTAKELVGKLPVFGICLGHQIIGQAFGARTFKLKFGHRGGNHPVKDLGSGRVYITAQNHGYAVDPTTLDGGAVVSHVNLNDGTVEGLRHPTLPLLTIQYHSEASPGPWDNLYMFERFLEMVRVHA